MRRLGLLVTALVLAGSTWLACSFSHDALPGSSCASDQDCFNAIERCNATTKQCEVAIDAAPLPDAPPKPDAAPPMPDADLPDADLADADLPDADLPDAELPDAS